MIGQTIEGILLPFCGTALGAACVFFMKGELDPLLRRSLLGFAAGVMTAASVWSLLLPAMEQSAYLGRLAFLPAAMGCLGGVVFLLALDWLIGRLRREEETGEGALPAQSMLMLAVTLHNVPEGMAVGVVYAGLLYGSTEMTVAGALVLSLGIALQNIPEGAIISLPMQAAGRGRWAAFGYGVLSGAAEPAGALLTILAAGLFVPIMPYLLSFSAGAMLYVTAEELLPEIGGEKHSVRGLALFGIGFVLMMSLDVALG